MKTKKIKLSVCGLLLAALLLAIPAVSAGEAAGGTSPSGGANTGAGAATVTGKSEVVYAMLSADGAVREIYTVNHFEVAKAGTVTDYGNYSEVQLLANAGEIAQSGSAVSFEAAAGNAYYQGKMEKTNLPWDISVSYTLSGAKVAPEALAGKSGALEIGIAIKKGSAADDTFYDNYMLQVSLTLDTDRCSNIAADGGTLASAGKNTVVSFTALPGKDAAFTLKADVADFEMAGIDIAGLAYSMNFDLPDTDEMIGEFGQLTDAIAQLNDGIGILYSELKNEMAPGAAKLVDGASGIGGGLVAMRDNFAKIVAGSAEINRQLQAMIQMVGGTDVPDPSALGQLPTQLRSIAGGLTAAKTPYDQALSGLGAAIGSIQDTAISGDQIAALKAASGGAHDSVIDTLYANHTAAQAVKGTWSTVSQALSAASTAMGGTAGGISQMADAIEAALNSMSGLQDLTALLNGLQAFATEYGKFHGGLVAFRDGIQQFIDKYGEFESGMSRFAGGVSELTDGVGEIYDGTSRMNREMADLPDTIRQEIDDLLAEYTGGDFEPVSFTSKENGNIGLVQFVLKTDAIQAADSADSLADEPELEQNFWDRFVALFKKD